VNSWLRVTTSIVAIGHCLPVIGTARAEGGEIRFVTRANPAWSQEVAPANAPPEPAPAQQRPNINPYDRDIEITAPLQFNQRILGELPVLLTRDDRFIIDSEAFLALIGPLLTPDASTELRELLADKPNFLAEEIAASGIRLDYDAEQLAVLVVRIAPEKRSVEILYQTSSPEAPGDLPLPFSAFLNVAGATSRFSQDGRVRTPELFLNGAIRYNNLVLEGDAQTRRDFGTDAYRFERRYTRLVYDEPEQARRWFAGDLDPETRGRQGFVNVGGVGVVRQRQRFDSFRNNVLSAGRRLVLQEQSTIRVSRNGLFQREFTLDPGQYDISNLPLDTGSNNIEIEIQGLSGARQSFAYQAYLDTIDLEPGDHEYGAYVGILGRAGFGSPDYSGGEPVFTGFWRKAFLNSPAIGIGAQFTRDIQNLTGQTQIILGNGGRARFDVGGSNSPRGAGFAVTAGYDQVIGGAAGYDTLSVVVDYTSARYSTVEGIEGIIPVSWNLGASYTKRLTANLFATANLSYRQSRSATIADAYSVSATANYRLSREWSVQVGAEYTRTGFPSGFGRGNGFGVTLGLVWQPRYDRRGEARYNSIRNFGSARFQQSAGNHVGAFGYSVATTYTDTNSSIGGQVDYVGNRFASSVSHSVFGTDFGNIGDSQITTARVSSSISYAGGRVAIGRTINDSFALVYPHKTLKGRPVIVGDGLEGGRYVSRSGALGPAVQNNLMSYLNQSVRYDVADPPLGYDVGEGVKRVRPAYKSAYVIEVGSAAFVSAIGTLKVTNGDPIKLASGLIRRADSPDAKPEPFFTNTVGRFAIAKLEPGVEYSVEFYSGGTGVFSFTVPEDVEGLLDLGVVEIKPSEGQ